jgi:hypothetical protein
MKNFFFFLSMRGSSFAAKKEASVEMIINLIFSTLPIWFGGVIYGFIAFFSNDNQTTSMFFTHMFKGVFNNVSNGELLMYAAATLGPTLYLGLSSFGKRKEAYRWVRPQLITAILITLLATVIFFIARDKGFASKDAFVLISAIIYLVSLFLLFPSVAFEHDKKGYNVVGKVQSEDLASYIAGYRDHMVENKEHRR